MYAFPVLLASLLLALAPASHAELKGNSQWRMWVQIPLLDVNREAQRHTCTHLTVALQQSGDYAPAAAEFDVTPSCRALIKGSVTGGKKNFDINWRISPGDFVFPTEGGIVVPPFKRSNVSLKQDTYPQVWTRTGYASNLRGRARKGWKAASRVANKQGDANFAKSLKYEFKARHVLEHINSLTARRNYVGCADKASGYVDEIVRDRLDIPGAGVTWYRLHDRQLAYFSESAGDDHGSILRLMALGVHCIHKHMRQAARQHNAFPLETHRERIRQMRHQAVAAAAFGRSLPQTDQNWRHLSSASLDAVIWLTDPRGDLRKVAQLIVDREEQGRLALLAERIWQFDMDTSSKNSIQDLLVRVRDALESGKFIIPGRVIPSWDALGAHGKDQLDVLPVMSWGRVARKGHTPGAL